MPVPQRGTRRKSPWTARADPARADRQSMEKCMVIEIDRMDIFSARPKAIVINTTIYKITGVGQQQQLQGQVSKRFSASVTCDIEKKWEMKGSITTPYIK